ncbi:MAG: redoxin domain-containing protein [Aggregatilineales bacterium]
MKSFLKIAVGLLAMLIIPGSFAQESNRADLPVLRAAPELHDAIWLNTEVPLKMSDFRGQVVLVEMWTFDCINCINTLEQISDWYDTYADEGLMVIGNHYPEYTYEHNLGNLRAAIGRLGIEYPVIQDNDRETWSAYNNRFWPTIYLIDKEGNVRYQTIGEGRYAQTEAAIEALLTEDYDGEDITDTEVEDDDETVIVDTASEEVWALTPTDVLNVRNGPATSFDRVSFIAPGEAYYVLREVDGWYQILFDGAAAYVSGDFVEVHTRPIQADI